MRNCIAPINKNNLIHEIKEENKININSEWFKTYRIWVTNKETKERKKITIYWVSDWDEVLEILQRRNVNSDTYDIKIKKKYIFGDGCKGRLAQVDQIKKDMMERISE